MPRSLFYPGSFINKEKMQHGKVESTEAWEWDRERFIYRLCHISAVLTLVSGFFPFVCKMRTISPLTDYSLKPQVGKALCLVPGTDSECQWEKTVTVTMALSLGPSCVVTFFICMDSEGWDSSDFPGLLISTQVIYSTVRLSYRDINESEIKVPQYTMYLLLLYKSRLCPLLAVWNWASNLIEA